MSDSYDIVIVGGGPAGSTVGSMLKRYAPHLSVAVVEKENFPREHIGESLLPMTSRILDEIGAWEKVEAAGFPIKIGATYRWGSSDDLWDFNLLETAEIKVDDPRPGAFEGWRMRSTFQVDRAQFDKILLDHSAFLGCNVFEGISVEKILKDGDSITGLTLSDGSSVTGKHYVDASGNASIIRKAMGVEVEEPPALRNIAIWDHWDNAEWAVNIGVGGTRIQIMSLGYGWIWFIPISPTRTSIGLVCPAEYYRNSGKRTEELYLEAVNSEPRISALVAKATRLGSVKATKDWSFTANRMAGENWFLVGESAGFADPILSAGITMTMVGAKECAFTIIELEKGDLESDWIKTAFEKRQANRISQHIRFANFWYSGNGHFTDLVDFTAEIAKEAGFSMDPKSAWQWLGTGGFVSLETAGAGLAGHTIEQIKNIQAMLFNEESEWAITKFNIFEVEINGVTTDKTPIYDSGQIRTGRILRKGNMELPLWGGFRAALEVLQREKTLEGIIRALRAMTAKAGPIVALSALEAMEVMLKDGWITGKNDPNKPLLQSHDIPRTPNIDWNKDEYDPKVQVSSAIES